MLFLFTNAHHPGEPVPEFSSGLYGARED